MTVDEKIEFKWLTIWLSAIVFLYSMPAMSYPPRGLAPMDYFFMAMIPLGAFIFVRRGAPWRWLIYYGILGMIPFVCRLQHKLEIPYSIRTDPYQQDMFSGVYVPCLKLLFIGMVITVIFGFMGSTIKKRIKRI
jgi:hypothetical protein